MKVSDWIQQNIQHSAPLEPDTLEVVSDFTLMWSIFEASEAHNENVVDRIGVLSKRVAREMPTDAIDSQLAYWSKRYIHESGEPTEHFHYLYFREASQIEKSLDVLINKETSFEDKIEVCLLIVYRYRNNLFHGIKDITLLNDQVENLRNAIELLQIIMPYSGRYLFLGA
ncbi:MULTISPECIES: hypothetical protein [Enterobacteriaceae]|nr:MULTISPECIES: hypothetical protein [Enterobacteriaceae]EFL3109108.1 hypothetical protein [Escherichia coli]AYZ19214.1 hypothetical protein EGY08_22200 [Klebsiella sp. FDAARGOS_511]EHN5611792.1 hypothetical protein [Escherichia coli]EHR0066005.1 hypothetical protein [Escherichia coli]EHS6971815.1 hypothetical protein [Escherichia coli]